MKNTIAILLTLGISSAGAAETPYARTNRLYDSAGVPTPARMLGWYSGRCFSVSKPTTAVAALLTTYRSHGRLKAVFWREFDQPADYYDRPTPEVIREIEAGLKKYDADIPLLVRKSDRWEAVHEGEHTDATWTRGNRKQIVIKALHDDEQTNACAFFLRVR